MVGRCKDGYICMDGDNWKIEQELSIYSYATLQAADICGLLMLDVIAPPPPPPPADDEKQEAAQLAALQAQLSAANAKAVALQAVINELHSAAISARQLLDPFGAADAQLVDALKKAGF